MTEDEQLRRDRLLYGVSFERDGVRVNLNDVYFTPESAAMTENHPKPPKLGERADLEALVKHIELLERRGRKSPPTSKNWQY